VEHLVSQSKGKSSQENHRETTRAEGMQFILITINMMAITLMGFGRAKESIYLQMEIDMREISQTIESMALAN
jgi:hypothetical protein